jgi:hypothetical protein
MCVHMKQTRTGSSCSKQGKPNSPVSSIPTAIRGTVGSGEGVILLAKWHLTRGTDKIHNNSRSCGSG